MTEAADIVAIILSSLSMATSAYTLYLTRLRKGTLKMTRPNIVAFAFDGPKGPPKVFLRTLLFSTAERGQVIENMFIKTRHSEAVQTFSAWGHGIDPLVFGSGIHVPHEGLATNHHFLPPDDRTQYEFLPGDYTIEVHASILGKKSPLRLHQIQVTLNEQMATAMKSRNASVAFIWNPDSGKYLATLEPSHIPPIISAAKSA